MKLVACCFFVLLAVQTLALAEVPKSIFDDDWKPAAGQQAQPPAQVSPTPNPTPPATPTPPTPEPGTTPPPTPVTPPAPVDARLPVPTAAAQADAWKLIKGDLYKDDIAKAKTPAQKVELAQKLLTVAGDTTKDMVGKYVLLAQAKELAIGSGDPPTAFKCLDELGKVYDVNYPVMKLELFAALGKTVSAPADCEMVVKGLNRWADGQVKGDRYDAAKKACEIALTVAHKDRGGKSVNQTLLHQKQIGEIEVAYLSAKTAMVTLAGKPNDPAANLIVGRFCCFMKGDWDKGLPRLALGSDAGLKALAQKELAGVSGADAQVVVGDSWWTFAENEKGQEQDSIRKRAVKWYNEALPNLEGLAKAKAEKRVGSSQAKIELVRVNAAKGAITNSVGMSFIPIEPGEFMMGSPLTEVGRDTNETLHHVKITKPYRMAATTVTQAQWKAVMGNNPSEFQGDNRPVEHVSWNDAVAFCEKLSMKEGKHYRLPTEAEWEYACRAGTKTSFSFGEIGLDDFGWYKTNCQGQTQDVATKKPNGWGLFDMQGNVYQWCSDAYGPYGGDAIDPKGANDTNSRVVRGGSWSDDLRYCRAAYRGKMSPTARLTGIAFRVCLDL